MDPAYDTLHSWAIFGARWHLISVANRSEHSVDVQSIAESWAARNSLTTPDSSIALLIEAASSLVRDGVLECDDSQVTHLSLLNIARPKPSVQRTERAAVLEVIRAAGSSGLTREQAARRAGLSLRSVCWRARELLDSGHLYESSRKRRTSLGKSASILVAFANPSESRPA